MKVYQTRLHGGCHQMLVCRLKKREIQQIYIILLDWKLSTNEVKQQLTIRYMVKSVGISFSFLETNIKIMKKSKMRNDEFKSILRVFYLKQSFIFFILSGKTCYG